LVAIGAWCEGCFDCVDGPGVVGQHALHQRMAAELTGEPTAAAQTRPGWPVHSTRRRLVQATSVAAAAAAVGAVVDHAVTNRVPAGS
jgi:hypothetical protein